MAKAYAHTKPGVPQDQWHPLEEHLRSVAKTAARFASSFNAETLASYAGLWHDLGKFAPDWQQFLCAAGQDASVLGEDTPAEHRLQRQRGPDHSTAGAVHASRSHGKTWHARALGLVIASHHGGLPDAADFDRRIVDESKLERYLTAVEHAGSDILECDPALTLPEFFRSDGAKEQQMRRYEFFVRMLFSALVDADFLNTEAFVDAEEHSAERSGWPRLSAYVAPLRAYLALLQKNTTASATVRQSREDVLRWCLDAAEHAPGVFTLTVPTGGGKTLASLAFALSHAVAHDLDRVIIALPFLSILDQTAAVLQRIFEPALGRRVLVEHHSNVTPEKDTLRNRLAAENWDAPLVITTQVQLFESLFARRTSACRKLHNLSNSVIVLDEVQTLPVGLLAPILDSLQELRKHYGTSLLLTTATQPALHTRSFGMAHFYGFDPAPREIVPANRMAPLFESLRRVDVSWPIGDRTTTWSDLALDVARYEQALAIVHRRADAAELWQLVNSLAPGALHLSALMCPAHRREVLERIRGRLGSGDACRVVSTQLVEAGVDVDFPVVFRAMAGLESLAQSAGRCNREGKLDRGLFRVFRAATPPVGSLKHHKEIAETMLRGDPDLDLFAPTTFRSYFDRLYSERDRDVHGVQVSRQALNFEQTAIKFQMIDAVTTPVFIPYDSTANAAIEELRIVGPSRHRFRVLQNYAVSVYPDALRKLQQSGSIELVEESAWVLTSPTRYDPDMGLLVEADDSAKFVI